MDEDRVLDLKLQNDVAPRNKETPTQRDKHFAPATQELEAAKRLIAELQALRISNPQWHAQSSRKWYQPLTLWLEQTQREARDRGAERSEMQTISEPLSHCYYQMRFFDN